MKDKRNKFESADITMGYANSLKPHDTKRLVSDKMPGLCLKVEPTGYKSWLYFYRAKGRPARSISVGSLATTSPAKAREQVKKIANDLMNGKDPLEDRDQFKTESTLVEALSNFQTNTLTVSNSYRKSTIKGARNHFKNWIFRRSSDPKVIDQWKGLIDLRYKKISTITHEQIIKLHKHIGSKSPQTANRLIQYLRLAFNTFQKKKVNPCKMIKKELFKENEYDDYLNIEEYDRVLDNLFKVDKRNGLLMRSHYIDSRLNPVSCCLIAFQLCTGRRTRSEASQLKWSMTRQDRIILKETKTSKHKNSILTFFLSDKAKEILQVIRKERLQKYYEGAENKDWFRNRFVFSVHDDRIDYVFPSRDFDRKIANGKRGSTPYTVDVRATWKKILALSGVGRWLKPYATRHSLATYILNNGGNINQVMKVLGVTMLTAMRYAKLVPGSELEILNKIGKEKGPRKLVQVK